LRATHPDRQDGTAFTRLGRLNLRNAEHALSDAHSRKAASALPARLLQGAIRHFVMQKEILGLMLLTEHNLAYLIGLVGRAREAIVAGCFSALRSSEDAAW